MRERVSGPSFVRPMLIAFMASGILLSGGFLAFGGDDSSGAVEPPVETQRTIVEDYEYPGAARILEERGIRLVRGDGRILLADCDSQKNQIQVLSRTKGTVCFQATGSKGQLSLEIPEVYFVKGADQPLEVDVTSDGKTTSYAVKKNSWTPVAEATDPEAGPGVLVEITATA